MKNLVKQLNQASKQLDYLMKVKELDRLNSIKNNKFRIKIEWKYKRIEGTSFTEGIVDSFYMEGLENAHKIFNEYRKIGLSINLKRIELFDVTTNKKEKGVNFKY